MYLVTDRNTIAIIAEYPLTARGYEQTLLVAATFAQMPELYPSGIMIEKRNPDNTITQIITLTKA